MLNKLSKRLKEIEYKYYTKPILIDGLTKAKAHFKKDVELFLKDQGKTLENTLTQDEQELLLNLGSLTYISKGPPGFELSYLENEVIETEGPYMNNGQGYKLPKDYIQILNKMKELNIIVLGSEDHCFGYTLSTKFKNDIDTRYWNTILSKKKAPTQSGS